MGRRGWYLGVRGVEWKGWRVGIGLFGRQLDMNKARRRGKKVFMNGGDQLAILVGYLMLGWHVFSSSCSQELFSWQG